MSTDTITPAENKENIPPVNSAEDNKSDKEINFEALRKQNESLARKLASLEKEKSEAENKKLEEEGKIKELLEKERKAKEEILDRYQSEKRQAILEKELARSGINSELVDLILPSILSNVEFDDSNNPNNLNQVIDNLKANKPSLFEVPGNKPAGQIGTNSTQSKTTGTLSKDEAIRIANDPDASEYLKRKPEVDAALNS